MTLDEATKEFLNFIIKDRNHKDMTRYSFHVLLINNFKRALRFGPTRPYS